MTKNNKPAPKEQYENCTIARLFENSKFGEGALKSMPLDDEGLAVIAKHAKKDSSFLLKPGRRKDGEPVTTKNGDQVYFLEVLPPYVSSNASDDI